MASTPATSALRRGKLSVASTAVISVLRRIMLGMTSTPVILALRGVKLSVASTHSRGKQLTSTKKLLKLTGFRRLPPHGYGSSQQLLEEDPLQASKLFGGHPNLLSCLGFIQRVPRL